MHSWVIGSSRRRKGKGIQAWASTNVETSELRKVPASMPPMATMSRRGTSALERSSNKYGNRPNDLLPTVSDAVDPIESQLVYCSATVNEFGVDHLLKEWTTLYDDVSSVGDMDGTNWMYRSDSV